MAANKLTAADVVYIRNSKRTVASLAKKFGVNDALIRDVLRRKTYNWVVDAGSVKPCAKILMPRDELLRLIEEGHEWESVPPESVSLAVKSLRAAGVGIKRYVRYEIVDSDDFD